MNTNLFMRVLQLDIMRLEWLVEFNLYHYRSLMLKLPFSQSLKMLHAAEGPLESPARRLEIYRHLVTIATHSNYIDFVKLLEWKSYLLHDFSCNPFVDQPLSIYFVMNIYFVMKKTDKGPQGKAKIELDRILRLLVNIPIALIDMQSYIGSVLSDPMYRESFRRSGKIDKVTRKLLSQLDDRQCLEKLVALLMRDKFFLLESELHTLSQYLMQMLFRSGEVYLIALLLIRKFGYAAATLVGVLISTKLDFRPQYDYDACIIYTAHKDIGTQVAKLSNTKVFPYKRFELEDDRLLEMSDEDIKKYIEGLQTMKGLMSS